MTLFCGHSTAPSAQRGNVLAGTCVAQTGFTELLFVCESCLYSVDISMPLLLVEWQTVSEIVTTDISTS